MATTVKKLAEATPNSSHPNPLMSDEKLRQLYSTMLKCRLLAKRARALKMGAGFEDLYSGSLGQEATAVGAAIDLRPEDILASSHGDFILDFVKGTPLTAIFRQLYRRSIRPDQSRSSSDDHGYAPLSTVLSTATVTEQLQLCTDTTCADHGNQNDKVVMDFSLEGSPSPGKWHDALRFAGQRSLPIVFVRQSILLAESDSVKFENERIEIGSEVVEYCFPEIAVDRNDAIAVYRVAQEAIERARSGGGPTLINAQTIHEHEQAEIDLSKYRRTDAAEKPNLSDPIVAMERYLKGKGLFSEGWKKEITDAFQYDLANAVDFALNNRRKGSVNSHSPIPA